jgi:hypothetical protein
VTDRTRLLLMASLCACLLLVLPGASLASGGPCGSSALHAVAEAASDEVQPDAAVADLPEVGGVSVKHLTRKPRRTNRRLRVRNGEVSRSVRSHESRRATAANQMKVKSKRRRAKRALMRRLMSVRGGLQA